MNLGKKISRVWNKIICFFAGHTDSVVCKRCGVIVNKETNGNCFKRLRWFIYNIGKDKEWKGALKFTPGATTYEINLKTNELKVLQFEEVKNEHGKITERKAMYNPLCHYITAINDKNALRKANAYIRSIKTGVYIEKVIRD